MSFESFNYNIETMKKNNELNALTRALNSGIDKDMLYKAFRDLYEVTIHSKLAEGKHGLNVDGLFSDVNSEDAIYSLLDLVKVYVKHNIEKKQAIEETINLAMGHYHTAVSEDERSRHLTFMENNEVGVEGDVERARFAFWNMLKADLEIKVNELLD